MTKHGKEKVAKNRLTYNCLPEGEAIVISGISCRFPEADNMHELRDLLINGVNCITDDERKLPKGIYGLPGGMGKIRDLSKFDAEFFEIPDKMANLMDPQIRVLFEVVYEAIVDAGIHPDTLKGSRTGVFCGNCFSEMVDNVEFTNHDAGDRLLGNRRSFQAGQISYYFDFIGPSYVIDSGCSSAFTGLDNAVAYMQSGVIDQAVVCGTNTILRAISSMHFQRLGMLSPDSKCKTFDASADGYARSEAIGAIFVERLSMAKRVYCKILHIKTNSDGYTIEGITFPSKKMQTELITSSFEECSIDPKDIAFMEAHGTGTTVGDLQEINVIYDVLCSKRDTPLLIGSVKSNLGHSEASAGLCQIAKIIIASETGLIPPNLHFDTPNPGILGLQDDSLKVITEPTPWNGGIVAINSFGFGGTNTHSIFETNTKIKKKNFDKTPKLFAVSGRTEEAVDVLLSALQKDPDPELLGLLSEIIDKPSPKHGYRGYTILNKDNAEKIIQKEYPKKRPLWYAFPGIGSQWVGMARDMMRIKIFQDSMLRSYDTLRPHKVNLMHLIKTTEEEIFHGKITHACVCITSIQIALLDCLSAMGLSPDGVIGCSIGELACAYADGCLTAEQALLVSFWIGHCLDSASFIKGTMANVGISAEDALKGFPQLSIAEHLAKNIITLTGSVEYMKKSVEKILANNIPVKVLNTCGKVLHCSALDKITADLMKHIDQLIPNPKRRSSRWITTAFSKSQQNSLAAQTASSAYFAKNIVNCVYLNDGVEQLPRDAIVLEISPDCVLKSCFKDTQIINNFYFGLADKSSSNQLCTFLNSLGQLFMTGYDFCVSGLYPSVEYPVSVGTSMISPLIKWDHDISWLLPTYDMFATDNPVVACSCQLPLSPSDTEMLCSFYKSHVIDGRILFPATGYLVVVWEIFAKLQNKPYTSMTVQFENVKFHRATVILVDGRLNFHICISKGTGYFEILESNEAVVSGYIFEIRKCDSMIISNVKPLVINESDEVFQLDADDIYKELRLRGYEYGPEFQGLLDSNIIGQSGHVKWNGNWITYLDSVFQFGALADRSRKLGVPTGIQRLQIIPSELSNIETKVTIGCYDTTDEIEETIIWGDLDMNLIVSGGVRVQGLGTTIIPRAPLPYVPTLEKHKFIPYNEECCFEKLPQLKTNLQEYNDVCCNIIQQGCFRLLGQKLEFLANSEIILSVAQMVPPTASLDSNLYTKDNNFISSLQQVLQDIFALTLDDEFQVKVSELMMTEGLVKDSLLSSLTHWRALKPCLDVAAENSKVKKLKIVELDSSRNSVAKSILDIFTNPFIELIYTMTESLDDKVNALKEANKNMKCARWDVESQPFISSDNDMIVCVNLFVHHQNAISQCVKNIAASLKPGGFILFFEMIPNTIISSMLCYLWTYQKCVDEAKFKEVLENENLIIVSHKSDGIFNNIFLVRKATEVRPTFMLPITMNPEDWLETLKTKHADCANEDAEDLWLISEGQSICGILGLVNAVCAEGNQRVRCLFDASINDAACSLPPYEEIMKKDLLMNVYKNGEWGSYRFLPIFQDDEEKSLVATECAHLHYTHKGDLSSLRWFSTPLLMDELNKQIVDKCGPDAYVYYAALNFRDILITSGRISINEIGTDYFSTNHVLGLDYAGRLENGKRVCGVAALMGLATVVKSHPLLYWEIPDELTMEDAATIPAVYSTVIYALFIRTHLQASDSILIHSGTGGVGQAAIHIALKVGCKVYTTVGSEDKRNFLKKLFPQLTDDDISCSHDLSFEQHIMKMTNGRGVDVILNSLAEEKLVASVRCLAENGTFIEIGKYDLLVDNEIDMKCFLKNATYQAICFDALIISCDDAVTKLSDLVAEFFSNGMIRPLNRTVFDCDEAERAFRYMASGKHTGKVLLKIREEEADCIVKPAPLTVSAIPYVECDRRKSYIITGGLGGVGLELIHWLTSRGACNITVNSRSEPRTGYQKLCLKAWEHLGNNVQISTDNIATEEGARNLIANTVKNQGPVDGIFHLALVLKDALLENQTEESYEEVLIPKLKGAIELDKSSRELCPDLKWFVLFSSIVSGHGNAGQTNYAFANSTIERIAEKRVNDGLCGVAIQWGIIGDVGVAYELMGGNRLQIEGLMTQSIKSCLSSLKHLLLQPQPVVSCMVLAPRYGGSHLKKKQDMMELFLKVFGLKKGDTLNPNATLGELGMDSLMGVEIKQILQRDYNKELSVQEIRSLSIQNLLDMEHEGEEQ